MTALQVAMATSWSVCPRFNALNLLLPPWREGFWIHGFSCIEPSVVEAASLSGPSGNQPELAAMCGSMEMLGSVARNQEFAAELCRRLL